MDKEHRTGVNGRAVSSLLMLFCFLLFTPSGLMPHISSSDRFEARRHLFMTVDNICVVIFIVSAFAHFVLNRRAIGHCTRKRSAGYRALAGR